MLAAVGWPVLDRIRLGPLAISPHGVGIAIGYLLGAWWLMREGRRRGLTEEHVGSMVMWALVGAIVGARAFYVLGHFSEFDSIGEVFAVWRGGLTLLGGIVGAILFGIPLMRRYGYRFGQVMDPAAIGLAFGISVGRIGDLVIGDHLGKPTDFFLGFRYSGGQLPGPWVHNPATDSWTARWPDGSVQVIQEGSVVHQTALYDMLIAGALFLFLFWLNRKPRREGVLIATFAIWYGAGRVITDFLRIDKTWLFDLTGSQWTAIGAIALGLGALVWMALRPGPGPAGMGEPPPERPTTAFVPPREPGGG